MANYDDIVEDFVKDSAKENDGVWMTYKRFQYRVARAHRDNVAFAKAFEVKMRPYQWALDRNNLAAIKDVADGVLKEVYAESILRGVRRVGATEELEFSTEEKVVLFGKLPDMWDQVFKFANQDENYSPDAVKADSGN